MVVTNPNANPNVAASTSVSAFEDRRQARDAGWHIVTQHPLLGPLAGAATLQEDKAGLISSRSGSGYAIVDSQGVIYYNESKVASPSSWAWVFGHLLLHLGLGHFDVNKTQDLPRIETGMVSRTLWNASCDCVVSAFLRNISLHGHASSSGSSGSGSLSEIPPEMRSASINVTDKDERILYIRMYENGVGDTLALSCKEAGDCDMLDVLRPQEHRPFDAAKWRRLLAEGARRAVHHRMLGDSGLARTPAQNERQWFMTKFPLLGALASCFRIVDDAKICRTLGISIAAVSERRREIYINPDMKLTSDELRFVMAHELLHVGLRHLPRCQGRNPFLWNVACDYVVNRWLIEMKIGKPPKVGILHDEKYANLSADQVYTILEKNRSRYHHLITLGGRGNRDFFEDIHHSYKYRHQQNQNDLDNLFRRCFSQGLLEHDEVNIGRGSLPLGLLEDIKTLAERPVPWDVQLAMLFRDWFPSIETVRTYARASRRQSATPDIPRPRVVLNEEQKNDEGRTFAVILDTSGSMSATLLGRALGAIVSYAFSREVYRVRLILCDAEPYDEGFISPELLRKGYPMQGRGGTVLQPAIDYLDAQQDFPKDGPLLVITDGACDELAIHRPHALLVPAGAVLPFDATGPIFYFS